MLVREIGLKEKQVRVPEFLNKGVQIGFRLQKHGREPQSGYSERYF